MQKFLIIVKFASIDHFCQFYRQFTSGTVFLPSTKPLPEGTHTLLHLWIPGIKTSFLFPGKIVPASANANEASGMTVDVGLDLPHLLPELNQALAGIDDYLEALDLLPRKAPAPSVEFEFMLEELEIAEPVELVEPDEPIEEEISGLSDDSPPVAMIPVDFALQPETDDSLMGLEMENPEFIPKKSPPPQQPEAFFADSDLEFQLQSDDDEARLIDEANKVSVLPPSGDSPDLFTDFAIEGAPDLSIDSNKENISRMLFEDIRHMVTQVEFDPAVNKPPVAPLKKRSEKKDLSTEERELAEPVGKFFMNLTKAILRSGYYAPGHPGVQSAKEGLYDEFISVSGGSREIMITHQSARDTNDIVLTGFLDEPVSIRQLVGPGIAELFVPKLCGYCENKKLLGFAVKREITPDHFYGFIDIMSDPKVDDKGDGKAGKDLTTALISRNITEISTVFVADRVELEGNLPWRVQMAIHRLAKDLKVMPMFQGESSDAVKKMKLLAVQDIIRPLKEPRHLNDFLVNCYLIAESVDTMKPEEIEEMIVAAFSPALLLPATSITFEDFSELNRLKDEEPDNPQIQRRQEGIQRILKLIAKRVVAESIPGAQRFLEQLHENHMVNFDELPADVQYFINSVKMANDVHDNFLRYNDAMNHVNEPSEALVYLQCFRRVIPLLIGAERWDTVSRISGAVKAASARPFFKSDSFHTGLKIIRKDSVEHFSASPLFQSLEPVDRPLAFIFKDVHDNLVKAFTDGDINQRRIVHHVIDDLGSFGVSIFGRILINSQDKEVRKLMYESLIAKGLHARNWAISLLDNAKSPWFTHRNALMVLGKVSRQKADFESVRKYFDHSNPKIREEVLNVIVSLRPDDGASLIISALNDEDPKVRWRAGKNLNQVAPLPDSAMNQMLHPITLPLPKDKDQLDVQIKKCIGIMAAIITLPSVPMKGRVESEVLMFLQTILGEKKSFWKKVVSVVGSDHEAAVLSVAVPLLGKVGGDDSKTFLKQAVKSYPELSEIIKKAALQIK